MGFFGSLRAAFWDEWRFLCGSFWDRAQISWIPLLLMLVLASVFVQSVPRALPVAVVDLSHSPISRGLVRALEATPSIAIKAQPLSLDAAWPLLRRNEVYALLFIPQDLDANVAGNQSATLIAYYNASLPTSGLSALRDMSSAVSASNKQLMIRYGALSLGPLALKPAPIEPQLQILYNGARNFELFLLGLLLPGILHLLLCITVTSAYGRELRDGSIATWLSRVGGDLCGAVLGKALPYILVFTGYAFLALGYVAVVRGDGVAGSWLLLLLGTVLLYCAYAAIGLLLVGLTRNMATALSGVGLYAGTSLAFCGATFPIDGAPWFARFWHQMLPFSAYVKLDAAERYMDASLLTSLSYIASLLLFVLVPLAAGLFLYRKALNTPSSWGQR